jgi:photosystem II stability/assembly factor-like uncharacterized protein
MKLIISTLILSVISLTTLQSQNVWHQTNGPNSGNIHAFCITALGNILTGTAGGGGIFRSTNSGNTWIKSNFPATLYGSGVMSIVKNSSGNLFTCGSFNGVYISTDDGINWSQQADTTIGFFSMGAAPNGYLYGSKAGYQGIWKSTNNGIHWIRVSQPASQYPWIFVNRLGYIFAAVDYGLIRSTDEGNTWQQVGYGQIYVPSPGYAEDLNGNIYIGNYNGIFKSTNNGTNWVLLRNFQSIIWSITCTPGGDVYLGNGDGAIFKSTDAGNNWIESYHTQVQGSAAQVFAMASTIDGKIYAGMNYLGIVRSIDNGVSWDRINTGILNGFISSLKVISGNKIYAGTYNDGLHKSTDGGNSWVLSALSNKYIFSIGSGSQGDLFVSTNSQQGGMLRSTDEGVNWTKINSGFNAYLANVIETKSPAFVFAGTQSGFFMSSNNGDNWSLTGLSNRNVNTIIVLTNGDLLAGADGLYRSTNNGMNWSKLDSTAFPQSGLKSIAKSPTGFILASSEHLYRSSDNGNSWTLVNDLSFSTMVINSNGYAVGGRYNQNGIFLSTNGGYNWSTMNSGIPDNFYTGLLDIDSSGYIYYSSWGSSIFRTDNSILKIEYSNNNLPVTISLSQNYPNPFNPTTKIRFEISGTSAAQTFLNVYDLLGREVATLVNEELKPGTYEVDWNAENYPSGVYFYKLNAGEFSETKKMVLVK